MSSRGVSDELLVSLSKQNMAKRHRDISELQYPHDDGSPAMLLLPIFQVLPVELIDQTLQWIYNDHGFKTRNAFVQHYHPFASSKLNESIASLPWSSLSAEDVIKILHNYSATSQSHSDHVWSILLKLLRTLKNHQISREVVLLWGNVIQYQLWQYLEGFKCKQYVSEIANTPIVPCNVPLLLITVKEPTNCKIFQLPQTLTRSSYKNSKNSRTSGTQKEHQQQQHGRRSVRLCIRPESAYCPLFGSERVIATVDLVTGIDIIRKTIIFDVLNIEVSTSNDDCAIQMHLAPSQDITIQLAGHSSLVIPRDTCLRSNWRSSYSRNCIQYDRNGVSYTTFLKRLRVVVEHPLSSRECQRIRLTINFQETLLMSSISKAVFQSIASFPSALVEIIVEYCISYIN